MGMNGRRLDYETGLLELTDKQELFLDWLCGNRPEGETQAEFAQRIGVAASTLRGWKQDSSFTGWWERRLRETHAAPDVINGHLEALNKKGRAGDVAAIKLYHDIVEKMWPEDRNQDDNLVNLTDQQLVDLAESMDLLRASSSTRSEN